MKKEIRFSAKLDTQEFDRTVENLQRRLRDIYSGTGQTRLAFENAERLRKIGIDPGASAPDSARVRQMEDRARRETDLALKQQVKDHEKINKQLSDQKNYIKNQIEIARELKKNGEERAHIQEKIVKGKKEEKELEKQLEKSETEKTRLLNARESLQKSKVARAISTARRAAAIGGAILSASDLLYQGLSAEPQENIIRGQAAQVRNQQLKSIFKTGGMEEALFASERRQANAMAEKATTANFFKEVGSVLGNSIITAATTALTGAAFAGVPGAILGAAGGLGVGLYSGFSKLPAKQEAFKEAERQRQFEAFKEQSGLRKLVIEDFLEEAAGDVATQRNLGISDSQLMNFYGRGAAAGFSRQSMRGAQAGILGAGGTTAGARNLSGYALQLQRDYDLTNSQQLLGRISGVQGGSEEAARRSIAAIFEGSVKAGLDKSEFREENRKFTDAVAQVIYRTGAADPVTQMLLSERRAGFIADKTTRGLEAAESAASFMSQRESQSQGLGSVLEIGGMQSAMPSLDPYDLQALQNMTYDEILAMPEEMQAYYAKKGYPHNKLLKIMEPLKELKTTGQPGLFEPVEKLKKLKDKNIRMGVSSPEEVENLMATKGEVQRAILSIYGKEGATPQIAKSMTEKLYAGQGMTPDEAFQKAKAEAGLPGAAEPRAADELEKARSAMDQVMIALRDQFKEEVFSTAKALGVLQTATLNLAEQYRQAVAKGDTEAAKALSKDIVRLRTSGSPPTQTTAAAPSPSPSPAADGSGTIWDGVFDF